MTEAVPLGELLHERHSQCCQLSGVSFRTEMSSFPDFQLHFRIFFVRCLVLSFDITAAVGSKSEGKAGRGGSTRPYGKPFVSKSIAINHAF